MTSQVAAAVDPALTQKIANTIRFLSADAVQKAGSGHPGMPMGCADIAAVLLTRFLRLDPNDPKWFNRDRFVLSAGHGSALLYSMLHLAGMLTLEDLRSFRQIGSRTPGHPEYGVTPGVDITTGPLGTGFSAAVGMALAERMLAETYNTPKYEVVDHFTYVLMSDGDNMEGVTQEAASLAGHLHPGRLITIYDDNESKDKKKLCNLCGRLIAIYDDNEISIAGPTELTFTENVNARFEALGWQVQDVDGHDHEALAKAIIAAQKEEERPSLIVAHTTIAKGAPTKAGTAESHGAPLGEEEIKGAKEALGWPQEEFHVPPEVLDALAVKKNEWAEIRQDWDRLFAEYEKKHKKLGKELRRVIAGELPKQWKKAAPEFSADEKLATRVCGSKVINAFGEVIPELVGGAADLEPSTKTEIKTGKYPEFLAPGEFLGRNIHFGVREHAMGHIVNGMALHGGLIPFGATFMVFHDFMRPAVRLAALMKIRSIFVYTHDSIFVGEDGPTHQPVEQLAAMRAIPDLHVFRPCDGNETAFAWQYAIERQNGPTAICLTRQSLPTLDREECAPARETVKGGYILSDDPEGPAEIAIVASGSEVHLAMEVCSTLRDAGRTVRVVSMPSLDVFKEQPEGYRKKVLPKRIKKRLVMEAGVEFGWEGILGDNGVFVGVNTFGVSGPYKSLVEKFGFTIDAVVDKLAEADF